MRIKTYKVDRIAQSAKMIEADLGENAVIISTKRAANGQYEIIAASEPQPRTANIDRYKSNRKTVTSARPLELKSEKVLSFPDVKEEKINLPEPKENKINTFNDPFDSKPVVQNNRYNNEEFMPDILKQAIFILTNIGVESDIALEFVTRYCRNWKMSKYAEEMLVDAFNRHLPIMQKMEKGLHYFIGYPGVGKSSIIMKIAHYLQEQGEPVVMFSTDHSRIAAGEDLKRFSSWGGFKYYDVSHLEKISKYRSSGYIILIDTPGNLSYDMISKNLCIEDNVHLVVDANHGLPSDLWMSIRGKNEFICLTKTDFLNETGRMLSIQIKSGRKLSFISDGPKVPNNLKIVNNENISKILLGEENNKSVRNRLSSWMRSFTKIKK